MKTTSFIFFLFISMTEQLLNHIIKHAIKDLKKISVDLDLYTIRH